MSWKPNKKIKDIIKKALAEGNADSAELLKKNVSDNAPVDTGKLAKSIEVVSSDDGMTMKVIAKVPYATAVEFGVSFKKAPNPYFRSAVKESRTDMLKAFKGKL